MEDTNSDIISWVSDKGAELDHSALLEYFPRGFKPRMERQNVDEPEKVMAQVLRNPLPLSQLGYW